MLAFSTFKDLNAEVFKSWIFFVVQVTRLEGQVTRYKSAAENAEKIEDDLKAEKRKLQREVEYRFLTLELQAG